MTPAAVSVGTGQALCEATERLFTGQPTRTDGKLTKNNLWREAGVGRATMNRATSVLQTGTTASAKAPPPSSPRATPSASDSSSAPASSFYCRSPVESAPYLTAI